MTRRRRGESSAQDCADLAAAVDLEEPPRPGCILGTMWWVSDAVAPS